MNYAGEDQTVYAWIDGFADVTLDGSDSNDADGDELTYKWMWTIDANTYEANSVSPTIELPRLTTGQIFYGTDTIRIINPKKTPDRMQTRRGTNQHRRYGAIDGLCIDEKSGLNIIFRSYNQRLHRQSVFLCRHI